MLTGMMDISGEEIALIAILGGILITIIGMITCAARSIARTKEREQSKREIAAYVAEGSISPQDAERLLRADRPHWERGDPPTGGRHA